MQEDGGLRIAGATGGFGSVPVSCRCEICRSRELEWCGNGGSDSVMIGEDGGAKKK